MMKRPVCVSRMTWSLCRQSQRQRVPVCITGNDRDGRANLRSVREARKTKRVPARVGDDHGRPCAELYACESPRDRDRIPVAGEHNRLNDGLSRRIAQEHGQRMQDHRKHGGRLYRVAVPVRIAEHDGTWIGGIPFTKPRQQASHVPAKLVTKPSSASETPQPTKPLRAGNPFRIGSKLEVKRGLSQQFRLVPCPPDQQSCVRVVADRRRGGDQVFPTLWLWLWRRRLAATEDTQLPAAE